MNKKTWKRILILFSIALNIGFVADGIIHFIHERQSLSRHDSFSASGMENAFYHRIGLSDDQHDRIDQLLNDYAAHQRKLKQVNNQTRVELVRLIAVYKESDRPTMTDLIEQMATIKKKREALTAEHLLAVRTVLDDRQAEALFSRLLKTVEKDRE